MDVKNIVKEIKTFLDGKNRDIKYLVNVECDPNENYGIGIIHHPENGKNFVKIEYKPFLYVKDLKRNGMNLFRGDSDALDNAKRKYSITMTQLKTGGHKRLKDGYTIKVESDISYYSIMNFFKDAGYPIYQKLMDDDGNLIYDRKTKRPIYAYKDNFYMPKLTDQFFISTGIRLFNGIEQYNDLHKVTYDIETTGLKYEHSRIFAIGIRDNKGYEKIIEVKKEDDDKSEIKCIKEFFKVIDELKPAIISGYNSENFDYEFILERANILELDIETIKTTLLKTKPIERRNTTVKVGNTTEYYTGTFAWGYSIVDILHATKKAAALDTDMKNVKLKYVCQYADLAKENRMYIEGSNIGSIWKKDEHFLINKTNNKYLKIDKKFLEKNIDKYSKKYESDVEFKEYIDKIIKKLSNNNEFEIGFISGKDILRQYLLDDLWETEAVDNLYNQSTFLLAKIVPSQYQRISTMGNAAIWNILMTTWSYENDLAIPIHDKDTEKISGGLARCYKKGFSKNIIKIDFASLYPMEQLTWDIFPVFDFTGVMKKMLFYMTTTRNIYKKLANADDLSDSEIDLLKEIDYDVYKKFENNEKFTEAERKLFKVKQLPIKIINNSLFGSLGSGIGFNWSDNSSAARITCTGRLYLRSAIVFFQKFGLVPLLAVTDGVNFSIPEKTNIKMNNNGSFEKLEYEDDVDKLWNYNNKTGVAAVIELYNSYIKNLYKKKTGKYKSQCHISMDNDGIFDSCLNLSRINYALMMPKKDKDGNVIYEADPYIDGVQREKKKIKLTGNTIKSKALSEYIEDFMGIGFDAILWDKGEKFVELYNDYVDKIFYRELPLKKVASKSRFKVSINEYLNRGTDKNGRIKSRQAHMELVIADRERMGKEIFKEKFDQLAPNKDMSIDDYDIVTIMELVDTYLPPEPEIGSTIYYYNVGTRKSHNDVKTDPKTKEITLNSRLLTQEEIDNNATGEYNIDKYLAAFNERIGKILDGYDPEIRGQILAKIKRTKKKNNLGEKVENIELVKSDFKSDKLKLKNYDADTVPESLYLENKEVDFWNKFGYDPSLVWDGFKTKDDRTHGLLYPQVYQETLAYVNDKMVKKGKKELKSVNDNWVSGDMILFKTAKRKNIPRKNREIYYKRELLFENSYHIGKYNGIAVEILKNDIEVPITSIEKQWREEETQKRNELSKNKTFSYTEIYTEDEVKLFEKFKRNFNISSDIDIDKLFFEVPNARGVFDDFLEEVAINI